MHCRSTSPQGAVDSSSPWFNLLIGNRHKSTSTALPRQGISPCVRNTAPLGISRCQIKQTPLYRAASKPLASSPQLYLDKYGTRDGEPPPDHSAPGSRLFASSQVTKSPVVHPVSIQPLTNCSSRNSFVLNTTHFHGGYVPRCVSPACSLSHDRDPFVPISNLLSPLFFIFLRTLLRFFALTKNSTTLFSNDSTLLRK
jgi:hypothetical protein